jgi:hypothetical protein
MKPEIFTSLRDLFDFRKAKFELLYDAFNAVNFNWNLKTHIFLDMRKFYEMVLHSKHHEFQTMEFVSGVLSFASYYRHFFWKFGKVPSIFFCASSDEISSFGKNEETKISAGYIESEINFLKMITKYLPGTYFVDTKGVGSRFSIMTLLSCITFKDECNLVFGIASEDIPLLLCRGSEARYGVFLNGKRGTGVVTRESYSDAMAGANRPEELMALSGCRPDYPGVGSMRMAKAGKFLKSLNGKSVEEAVLEKFGQEGLDIYQKNFNDFDFNRFRLSTITPSYKAEILSQLTDLHDIESLKKINREWFSIFPIDIENLLIGDPNYGR